MRPRSITFLRAVSGATAVEFALVAGPMFLIIFGVFEFGRAMWTREALQSVAVEGARCMGVLNTSCAPSGVYSATVTRAFVQNEARKLSVALEDSAVTLSNNTSCTGVAGFSQVSINYTFTTLVPLLITQFQNGIPLVVSACFPNQPANS
jgi:Flp pilus assembly protein TadG